MILMNHYHFGSGCDAMVVSTIIYKIFETNSSFHVK